MFVTSTVRFEEPIIQYRVQPDFPVTNRAVARVGPASVPDLAQPINRFHMHRAFPGGSCISIPVSDIYSWEPQLLENISLMPLSLVYSVEEFEFLLSDAPSNEP